MIFGISIISTSGFPYYSKDFAIEPKNIPLKMYFFDYSKTLTQSSEDSRFDLMAGLIAAIFNFSNALNNKLGELVYFRPEFQIENLLDGQTGQKDIGTLITIKCESYCVKAAVKKKLDYLYEKIIKPLEPLSEKTRLAPSEEDIIQDVLLNVHSKNLIRSHSKLLEKYIKDFIKQHKTYGIKAVAILSNDFQPLKVINLNLDILQSILRSIGTIPEVNPLGWKFRQAWISENEQITLAIINSAFNVVYDTLEEPLYYLMICDEGATLGDLPRVLFMNINNILEK
ncbi:MAG: hypothetical protein ACTSVI_12730 [Promethearchaeota archaeon]